MTTDHSAEPVSSTPAEPLCWARYPSTDRTARIVHCELPAGHEGDHEEVSTESSWPAVPLAQGGIVSPNFLPLQPFSPEAAERLMTYIKDLMPITATERERAAYERGKAEGIAEGLRQATEGQDRAWGIQMAWKHGPMTLDCSDRATAEDYLTALAPEQREIATLVSRLVGPWEAADIDRCSDCGLPVDETPTRRDKRHDHCGPGTHTGDPGACERCA